MSNCTPLSDGTRPGTSPSISSPATICSRKLTGYGVAALAWLDFGLSVIPLLAGTKRPAVKWNPWRVDLSPRKIEQHWRRHPDHELGFIVGDDLIILDADSPQSIAALATIEQELGVAPALVVKTGKGLHHYFLRAPGTYVKSDAHCTKRHPERIDIKTGRAMVVLPPSTGKEILSCGVNHALNLSAVGQRFIDSVYKLNGRPRPSSNKIVTPHKRPYLACSSRNWVLLCKLVPLFDPDVSYDDWLRVGMIIFNETDGSDDGLSLYDDWSSSGKKYKGPKETSAKWKSFRHDHPNPVTINTLKYMVGAAGHDWMVICSAIAEPFEVLNADVEVAE